MRRPGGQQWAFSRLWRAMPHALGAELVEAVLAQSGDPRPREGLIRALSGVSGFRAETLARRAPTEVAALHGKLPGRRLPVPDDLFRLFHVEHRRPMLVAYLDAARIPHDAGLVEGDWEGCVAPERVRQGADAVDAAFAVDEAVVYFITLWLRAGGRRAGPPRCPGPPAPRARIARQPPAG